MVSAGFRVQGFRGLGVWGLGFLPGEVESLLQQGFKGLGFIGVQDSKTTFAHPRQDFKRPGRKKRLRATTQVDFTASLLSSEDVARSDMPLKYPEALVQFFSRSYMTRKFKLMRGNGMRLHGVFAVSKHHVNVRRCETWISFGWVFD